MKNQPIIIAGFGSIGRRHFRNLLEIGYPKESLIVYRTGKSTLPEDELQGATITYDLEEALAANPKAVVVANPSSLHIQTALSAARKGVNIFLEKPVSDSDTNFQELTDQVRIHQLSLLVGFQFRFHPMFRRAKQLLEEGIIGDIVSAQAHWGEYLPNWHPWEDYRNSYSAKSELGGGVVLTLCHPLDYLRWLVGDVSQIGALTGNRGGLGINVEDTADILLHFENGATGYVHLDYIQRPSAHWFQIIGQKGTIKWDSQDNILRCCKTDRDQWETYSPEPNFERNTMFLDEMHHFLACVEGHVTSRCTLEDGIAALKIALAAKQAAAEGKLISILHGA